MSKRQSGGFLGAIGIGLFAFLVATVAKVGFGIIPLSPGESRMSGTSAEVIRLAEIVDGIQMSAADSAAWRRIEQAATAAGIPTSEIEIFSARLTHRGLARLPDDLLLERTSLLLNASRRLDVETCGRMAMNASHDRSLGVRMMEVFTPEERQRWWRISLAAGESEVDQSPPRRGLTAAEDERLWDVFSDALTEAEFDLMMALEHQETLSSRDLCDVQILLLSAPEWLPDREGRLMARWLATTE